MIRKYHNHKLQTTLWHREEEPLYTFVPPPNPKQKTRKFVVGALIPSPKAVGLECVPPSSILLMLPLQIPCSLVVAKLMSDSCAPPPPPSTDQTQRN